MSAADLNELVGELHHLRRRLERGFGSDTAANGFRGSGPSTGQCAAATLVVREAVGGEYASASVQNQSHWFNRIAHKGVSYDVDLTGDQFGLPAVQVGRTGELYNETRIRPSEDVSPETIARAARLAKRAGMQKEAELLLAWLNSTS